MKQHETVRELRSTIHVPVNRDDMAIADVITAAESADPPRAIPYDRQTVLETILSDVDDTDDLQAVEEAAREFVEDYGEEFDPKDYSGNAKLRVDHSGTTTTSGPSKDPSGSQSGGSAGTIGLPRAPRRRLGERGDV